MDYIITTIRKSICIYDNNHIIIGSYMTINKYNIMKFQNNYNYV